MKRNESHPAAVLLFGATGDLAKRKLYPALYSLYKQGILSHDFAVIGLARSPLTREEYHRRVKDSIARHSRFSLPGQEEWAAFAKHFFYQSLDIHDKAGFETLQTTLIQLDEHFSLKGNRIFYLSMAPDFFGLIAKNLHTAGLTRTNGWKRLVIEKPFGHDLSSAEQLNQEIREVFAEEEIYRIDHYLGKEMVQNIEVIRFANSIFEPVWNNRYIDNVQITSSETVGVEERGGYYEKAGALRDMVQNHILQMVAMVAMEPPSRLQTEAIRDEKVKVLRSLRRYEGDAVLRNVVSGQYTEGKIGEEIVPAYRQEAKVAPDSVTETYVAAKLMVDNFRWAGVPFYVRTGKRMAVKSTEITVQFKNPPMNLYFEKSGELGPNLLTIHIQPDEGMTLHLNAKRPGTAGGVFPIAMEVSKDSGIGYNSPEAYERLLHDILHGDTTNFTRWDEVAGAWEWVDPITQVLRETGGKQLHFYAAGTMGPEAAHELLRKDGVDWWPLTPADRPCSPVKEGLPHEL
ncbi:Glucose-6-phosphate 1-dehydrogenase [[Clostridium] ultunense Esp]|nr:Glucose-6-phosphate 1-dehydrogenase [[Clostridium] ultunense Esp]